MDTVFMIAVVVILGIGFLFWLAHSSEREIRRKEEELKHRLLSLEAQVDAIQYEREGKDMSVEILDRKSEIHKARANEIASRTPLLWKIHSKVITAKIRKERKRGR